MVLQDEERGEMVTINFLDRLIKLLTFNTVIVTLSNIIFQLQNYSPMQARPILYLLLLAIVYSSPNEPPCRCINGGQCDPVFNDAKCLCPPQFIGQYCQLSAAQLSSQTIQASLTTNYSYFYFVPDEVNYYKMTFNICMLGNPSKSSALFYIETERNDGSLREVPSLFQTAKIALRQNDCTSFPTHYISVKRREDYSFRKIVIGLKVMEKEDKDQYLNTYYNLEQQATIPFPPDIIDQYDESGEKTQIISIKMKYEVYLQPSFFGTFAILFASFTLMVILVSFITYLKKKYTVNALDIQSLHDLHRLTRSLHRLQRFNNPEEYNHRSTHKFHQVNLEIFMPVTHYGISESIFVPHLLNNQQHTGNTQCQPQTCSICLIEFQRDQEIRTTPCKHRYHRQCIDNWFQNEFSCPMCRRKLDFRNEIRQLYYQFLRNELIV